jgi:hypothetical protein
MMASTYRANKEIVRFINSIERQVEEGSYNDGSMRMFAGIALGLGAATKFNQGQSQIDVMDWMMNAIAQFCEGLEAEEDD